MNDYFNETDLAETFSEEEAAGDNITENVIQVSQYDDYQTAVITELTEIKECVCLVFIAVLLSFIYRVLFGNLAAWFR